MPSSTSSSEHGSLAGASNERPLPQINGTLALAVALLLFLAAMGAWEWAWRSYGGEPAYRNSPGQWAIQRRRIDHGEGAALVIAGSSRMLFDINLDVWQRTTGRRPIQLAIEGTTPLPVVEDLADDPDFTGQLVIGVAPDLFFSGGAYVVEKFEHYHKETRAQRPGDWLSMAFFEPWMAFYEEDFALFTVLKRQDWPAREGVRTFINVRKLSVSDADRNTRMWSKVVDDPEYAALAQRIWAQDFGEVPFGDAAKLAEKRDQQIARAVAALAKLRARGVEVVFVRPPSTADYLDYENRHWPRADSWDRLLAQTGAPGIHFQDHAALQGYTLPEWSHMSASEAERFTAALAPMVEGALAAPPPGG